MQSMRCNRVTRGPCRLRSSARSRARRSLRHLNRFATEFPDVDVSLRTATSVEVSELVRRGQVAIGLRYFDDPSSDLTCTTVCHEKLLVVCARTHRLAGKNGPITAQSEGRALARFSRVIGTSRDGHAHHSRAVPKPRGRYHPLHARRQPDGAETAHRGGLRHRADAGKRNQGRTFDEDPDDDQGAATSTPPIPLRLIVRKNGYLSAASRRLVEVLKKTRF